MTAEELIAGAADVLEHGWCQYVEWDNEGRHCVLGALSAVLREVMPQAVTEWRDLKVEVLMAMRKEIGDDISFTDWNDTPGRTAEEVISTLRNAKRWL